MRRGRKLPAAEVVPAVEAHVTIGLAQDQMTRSDPNRAKTVHAQLISAIQTHGAEIITGSVRRPLRSTPPKNSPRFDSSNRPPGELIGAGSVASGRSPA